ncbi:MFS transporter [Lacticaseibacillus baoqingensis]|uniref:MFS transporter n=1 Tax=Lacticaseibacillus baoqingensis TaxID=2486013 RepID=A0ABW4E8X7_9LACO|nr:MFS transporter [Lacticaseibacillus baoqingensis]
MAKGNRGLVMLAVFIATFMTSVEVTIVTTALPAIIAALHGLAWQSWIMAAYLLTTAVTTPIYGKLADAYGRKPLFTWGVAVFTLGSLGSGLAPSILWLIAARAVQGIGAGAVMPLTFTIIADFFDYAHRAQVLALNNTAWGLSALIGPLLGGFLVDRLSWHWVFFVNVPLGVVVLGLVAFGYHETVTPKPLHLDGLGIAWLSVALVSLLLAVQVLATHWVVALGLLVVAVAAAIGLCRQEQKAPEPLIAPALFTSRTFSIQILTAAILSGVLIAYQVYFPIWLQALYHSGATQAGLVVSSSSVMWLAASFAVAWLLRHMVPRKLTLIVTSVQWVFYAVLVFSGRGFPAWGFYVIAAVNGAGMGIVISMNTVLSQHLAPDALVGSATALLTLGRSLGQTVMTGIYGAILNMVLNAWRGPVSMAALNRAVAGHAAAPQTQSVLLAALHAVFIGLCVKWC